MDNYDQTTDQGLTQKDDRWKEDLMHKTERSGLQGGKRKGYRDASPEEVKEMVKEQVSKGVAAAAGAVEGVAEEMEADNLPEVAGKAIGLVGETARTVAKASVDEARKTRDAIKGQSIEGAGTSKRQGGSGLGSERKDDAESGSSEERAPF
jgi:hypothetical protein